MKSEDMTIWQIIKHIFGSHAWSGWRHTENDDVPATIIMRIEGISGTVYRNCEICGQEYSIRFKQEKTNV